MNFQSVLVVIATVFWFYGGWWWYTCKIKGFCGEESAQQHSRAVAAPTNEPLEKEPSLALNDTEATSAKHYPMEFVGSNPSPRLHARFDNFVDSLQKLQQEDETILLELQGSFASEENNATSFTDLGLARAAQVKTLLADKLDTLRVVLKSAEVQLPESFLEEGFEGMAFAWSQPDFDAVAALQALLAQDISITFPFKSSERNISPGTENFLEKLADLLIQTEQNMQITGHTDSIGSKASNYALGRERARNVYLFLREQGVPLKQLSLDSKGKDEPVVSNSTDEGRAKNRRVTLRIQ